MTMAETTGETIGEKGESAADALARPLLARANLFRLRGQWDEAIAVCTEALQHAPHSPTAHALLGEIYEAQNKWEDALQWYEMAVELAPDNAADCVRLERVRQIQRSQIATERQATPLPTALPAHAPAEKTLEWFDRVFPPGRYDSIARLILIVSGIVVVFVLLCAAFLFFAFRAAPPPGAATITPPTIAPAPVVMQPTPALPTPHPSATTQTPDATANLRNALLPDLVRAGGKDVTIENAGGATVFALTLPLVAGEDAPTTRRRVTALVVQTARFAAAQAPPSLHQATVRVTLQSAATALAPPASRLAFTGDVSLAALRTGQPPATDEVLLTRFQSVQWAAPLLPPVVAAPAAPTDK